MRGFGGCSRPETAGWTDWRANLLLVVAGQDVVDGDVDGNGLEAKLVAEAGDDVALDLAGHLMDRVSVADSNS